MLPTILNEFVPCLTLYREGRNQSSYALRAIAHVIINRAQDSKGRWPKALAQVCLQAWQFSSFNRDDPNNSVWPVAVTEITWVKCCQAWSDAMTEEDFTGGANLYHSYKDVGMYPKWARNEDGTAKATVLVAGAFKLYRE